jgi:hypothetical protein
MKMKKKIILILLGLSTMPNFLNAIDFAGIGKKLQQHAQQVQKNIQQQLGQLKNLLGPEKKPVSEEKPTKEASSATLKEQLQLLIEKFKNENFSEDDVLHYEKLLSKCEKLNCSSQDEIGLYKYLGAQASLDYFTNKYYNKFLKGVKEKGPLAIRKAWSDLTAEIEGNIKEVLYSYGIEYNQLINNKQYYKEKDYTAKVDEVRTIYRNMLDLALLDILSDFNEAGEYKGDKPFSTKQKDLFNFLLKLFQQIDPTYAGMLEQKWKPAIEKAGTAIKSTVLSPMEKEKLNKTNAK